MYSVLSSRPNARSSMMALICGVGTKWNIGGGRSYFWGRQEQLRELPTAQEAKYLAQLAEGLNLPLR